MCKNQLSRLTFLFTITRNPQTFHFKASAEFTRPRETLVASVHCRYWAGVKGKHMGRRNWTDVVLYVGTSECFTLNSFLPHQGN